MSLKVYTSDDFWFCNYKKMFDLGDFKNGLLSIIVITSQNTL